MKPGERKELNEALFPEGIYGPKAKKKCYYADRQ